MRQWQLILCVSVAAVLTACGTGVPEGQLPPTSTSAIDPNIPTPAPGSGEFDADPFATNIPEGEAPTADPSFNLTAQALGVPVRPSADPNATFEPMAGVAQGITMPPPGVVVTNVTQEASDGEDDPPPGAQPFTEITLIRAGGITDDYTEIQILQDGTVTLNGELATVLGPQQIGELNQRLDELNFFGLNGTFAGNFQAQEDYLYVFRAVQGGASRSIRADDQLIPPQLAQFAGELLALAQPTTDRPAPPQRGTPTTP